jgi:hypothetical protein
VTRGVELLRILYVPVAVYWFVWPSATEFVGAEITIDCSERPTVNDADAESPPNVAVIVAVPSVNPEATPAALTVATVVFEEAHPAVAVASVCVPSL